jgi:FkbM family methyltransferase
LGVKQTVDLLFRHPLNQSQRVAAVVRYLRWQVGSLLAPGPILVRFVDDSVLLASFGMAAATGNIYAGLYEFEDMAFVLHFLRPDDLFVDVGANIGSYTILASAAVGADSISLEPVPKTFSYLMRNLQVNAIQSRVDARNVAAGAAAGITKFTVGLGPMNRVAVDGDSASIDVPIVPLDDLIAARKPVMIKIDVEGFETEVVRGARQAFAAASLQAVLLERNGSGKRFGFDEDELHRNVMSFGFRPYRYRPMERQIVEESSGGGIYEGNTLYLRNVDVVRARIAAARAYRVNGRSL